MKKLLLPIVVLALVVSCGKDNKVGGVANQSNPITIGDPIAVSVGSLIDNYTTTFGQGQATNYENWNQLTTNAPNVTYEYSNSTSTGFSYCWFGKCNTNITPSRSTVHSSVNILEKQNQLKAILNKKSPFQPIMYVGTQIGIITSDGEAYTLDTRLPIQANPVYSKKGSAAAERLINVR